MVLLECGTVRNSLVAGANVCECSGMQRECWGEEEGIALCHLQPWQEGVRGKLSDNSLENWPAPNYLKLSTNLGLSKNRQTERERVASLLIKSTFR